MVQTPQWSIHTLTTRPWTCHLVHCDCSGTLAAQSRDSLLDSGGLHFQWICSSEWPCFNLGLFSLSFFIMFLAIPSKFFYRKLQVTWVFLQTLHDPLTFLRRWRARGSGPGLTGVRLESVLCPELWASMAPRYCVLFPLPPPVTLPLFPACRKLMNLLDKPRAPSCGYAG